MTRFFTGKQNWDEAEPQGTKGVIIKWIINSNTIKKKY